MFMYLSTLFMVARLYHLAAPLLRFLCVLFPHVKCQCSVLLLHIIVDMVQQVQHYQAPEYPLC